MEISDTGSSTAPGSAKVQHSKLGTGRGKQTQAPPGSGRVRIVRKNSKLESDEFMAAAIGDTAWLKQSLRDGRNATTFDKNGLAAIHLAALHGRLDSLKLLIEKYGVDVNLPSSTGWRPIHLAINNRNGKRALQCVSYLIEKEADPSVFNDDDLTPAHQAAIEGTVKCLEALINAGAIIDSQDVKGHLPLDYAKLWGNRECARILTTEMWRQEKEHEAREMNKLMSLKQHQDEELERDNEVELEKRNYQSEQAFSSWLERKQLPKPPSAPIKSPKDKRKEQKPSKTKKQEQLYQPNSAARQDRTFTQRGMNGGDNRQMVVREDGSGYRSIAPPPSPPKQMYKPYQLSPVKEHAETNNTRQLVPLEDEEDSEYSDTLPRLPDEVIQRVLSGKRNPHDRPLVFKCKNIIDVQQKKFPAPGKRPQSEVYMHLSHDISSSLYPSNAHVLLRSHSTGTSTRSGLSSQHSGSTSMSRRPLNSYDRDRVATMMKQITKNYQRYPNINGPEFEFSFKIKS
ncbi:uncharacterized protein LOC144446596 [Glandiceps talaboti]